MTNIGNVIWFMIIQGTLYINRPKLFVLCEFHYKTLKRENAKSEQICHFFSMFANLFFTEFFEFFNLAFHCGNIIFNCSFRARTVWLFWWRRHFFSLQNRIYQFMEMSILCQNQNALVLDILK